MYRRLQLRRQITLLLVAMRISYGGTILALLLVNANTEKALIWQIVQHGGAGWLLILALVVSALLLLSDGLFEFLWPLISSQRAENACRRVPWLRVRWLHKLRHVLVWGCGLANKLRHWFYLPPAFACLFVVPVAAYIGANGVPLLSMLYIWLFVCGLGAALMEGMINNERQRHEKQ